MLLSTSPSSIPPSSSSSASLDPEDLAFRCRMLEAEVSNDVSAFVGVTGGGGDVEDAVGGWLKKPHFGQVYSVKELVNNVKFEKQGVNSLVVAHSLSRTKPL